MKTGLFGGTFDPIHNGHLKVAQTAKNCLQLDRIIFVPAGDPPHKSGKKITDKAHRLAMVELVAKACGAEVSDWELGREEKSYSVDLVRHFQTTFPEDEFYFIIGADSFYDLPTWWHYRELMSLCSFVVIARPDTEKENLLARFSGDEAPPRVFFLEDVLVDISSTQIRRSISEGKDVSQLVSPEVMSYIKMHSLYETN